MNEEENEVLNVEPESNLELDDYLCYTKRLRDLMKSIGQEEDLKIECGDQALERLQNSIKYLSVVFIYEIVKILKDNKKIRFQNIYIDQALDNLLQNSDALGYTLTAINTLKEDLEKIDQKSSLNKAMDYLYTIEPYQKES